MTLYQLPNEIILNILSFLNNLMFYSKKYEHFRPSTLYLLNEKAECTDICKLRMSDKCGHKRQLYKSISLDIGEEQMKMIINEKISHSDITNRCFILPNKITYGEIETFEKAIMKNNCTDLLNYGMINNRFHNIVMDIITSSYCYKTIQTYTASFLKKTNFKTCLIMIGKFKSMKRKEKEQEKKAEIRRQKEKIETERKYQMLQRKNWPFLQCSAKTKKGCRCKNRFKIHPNLMLKENMPYFCNKHSMDDIEDSYYYMYHFNNKIIPKINPIRKGILPDNISLIR